MPGNRRYSWTAGGRFPGLFGQQEPGLFFGPKITGHFEDELMKILKKFFAPKEVRTALGVLDELECTFACEAFRIVRHQIEAMILAKSREFAAIIRKGTSARQWVLGAVSNLSGDLVQSGEYHIHRGVLNPMGPGEDLLRIYDASADELVRMGVLEASYATKQREALRKNMQDVG